MGKKRMTFWIEDRQIEALKALSSVTRVKQADYIREGIDIVVERYQAELKKASKKKGGE